MSKKPSSTLGDLGTSGPSTRGDDPIVLLTAQEANALGAYLGTVHGIKARAVGSGPDLGEPRSTPAPADRPAIDSASGRAHLAKVAGQVEALRRLKAGSLPPPSGSNQRAYELICSLLVQHLGSALAAQAWLNSTNTGYSGSAMDAILEGDAESVLEDLCQQWGPSPAYA